MTLHELIWETCYSESNGVPTIFMYETIIVGSVCPSCTPRRYQFTKLSLPAVSLSLWSAVVFPWMQYACPPCMFSYCLLWSMLIQLYYVFVNICVQMYVKLFVAATCCVYVCVSDEMGIVTTQWLMETPISSPEFSRCVPVEIE